MKILKIVTSDSKGNKIIASTGISGCALHLGADFNFELDAENEVEFFSIFLNDIVINEDVWESIRNAITSGIYQPNMQPLILDCSWEGHDFVADNFENIHSNLKLLGINLNTVAYIQMCRNQPKIYNTWAESKGLGLDRLSVFSYWGTNTPTAENIEKVYCNYEGFIGYHNQIAANSYSGQLPPKRFLCMNNIIKPHRTSLALMLWEKFQDISYISFGNYQEDKITDTIDNSGYWFSNSSELFGRLKTFSKATPLVLDAATGSGKARSFVTFSFDPALYKDSSLSIVTESEMSSAGHLRITEKTFKPLGMFHPLILCGNKGSLQALREMGYRTFSPFINESYDEIENGPDRLKSIEIEIARLANLSDSEFAEGMLSIWPAISHNAHHTRLMLKEVQKLELEELYRNLRLYFSATFGIPPLKIAKPLNSIDMSDLEGKSQIPNLVEVRYSKNLQKIQIVQLSEKILENDIFVHINTKNGVKALSFNWPIGKSSCTLNLPSNDIDKISIGQFKSIQDNYSPKYLNLWKIEIGI